MNRIFYLTPRSFRNSFGVIFFVFLWPGQVCSCPKSLFLDFHEENIIVTHILWDFLVNNYLFWNDQRIFSGAAQVYCTVRRHEPFFPSWQKKTFPGGDWKCGTFLVIPPICAFSCVSVVGFLGFRLLNQNIFDPIDHATKTTNYKYYAKWTLLTIAVYKTSKRLQQCDRAGVWWLSHRLCSRRV